jgi:geranylgeranyl diphosphate synthase type I
VSRYDPYVKALDEELRELFSSSEGFLYDVLRYHLGWTGRRGSPEDAAALLRFPSMLALVSCEALSGDYRPALPAAAGVELVFNSVLVHEDAQTDNPEVLARPSIRSVWGQAQTINAGDGLHALGRAAVMRLARSGVQPDRVLRAVESLDRACLTLCEGQFMDLSFQDQLVITRPAFHEMISRKAGALAGCSAELGALAAGADDTMCARFGEMGRMLGIAWQVSRDVADLWSGGQDGPISNGVLSKKKSLPLVHVMEIAGVTAKQELGAIYEKQALLPEDVARLIHILDQAGSRDFAEGKAKDLVELALDTIAGAGAPEPGMEGLRHLGQWALQGSG